MAMLVDRVRGFIMEEARKRPSERLLHPNGRPNARRLAKKLGLTHQVMWRVLRGEREKRKGVKKPRVFELELKQKVLDGLMSWLSYHDPEDLWNAINKADPIPPFESTRSKDLPSDPSVSLNPSE